MINPDIELSRSFLKSVLLPALEDQSCIKNQMYLNMVTRNPADEDEDEDEVTTKNEEARAGCNELFSMGKNTKSGNYFVSLNLVGLLVSAEDTPPFFITIISRTNDAHLLLDRELDTIAKEFKCDFEHDLKSYEGYEFQNWVSKIPLDIVHINFLKQLFNDNVHVLTLLDTVASKLFVFQAKNNGFRTLMEVLKNIQKAKEINNIVEIQPETLCFKNSSLTKIEFENITAEDLGALISENAYVSMLMSKENYLLLKEYFQQLSKPDVIRVVSEEPFIVELKFVKVNEANQVIIEDFFYQAPLMSGVSTALNEQIDNLTSIFTQFYEASDKKLLQFYKKQFQEHEANSLITLSACKKPHIFNGGYQMEVGVYKIQCQVDYFIYDQREFGAEERILKLAGVKIPEDILRESGDTLLARMMGEAAFRRVVTLDKDKPPIYAGWDYGLCFVDLNLEVKKIYSDRGKDLKNDDLALAIPIKNLTLYFLLRYLDTLQLNQENNAFHEILKLTSNFIIDNQLALPADYHEMFFDSALIPPEYKEKIQLTYQQLLQEQVQTREEYIKLVQEEDKECEFIDLSSSDDDEVIMLIEDDESDEEIESAKESDNSQTVSGRTLFNNRKSSKNSTPEDVDDDQFSPP
ncbi:hypothetical protein [Legionella jamestowniensis]|uniref:hypothetical protein n=1 Tax=Legionella jamestowniensis TaxID=455 RepID=UPI00104187C1|nr:hypothetical protein [Legionella jamestowniensis]